MSSRFTARPIPSAPVAANVIGAPQTDADLRPGENNTPLRGNVVISEHQNDLTDISLLTTEPNPSGNASTNELTNPATATGSHQPLVDPPKLSKKERRARKKFANAEKKARKEASAEKKARKEARKDKKKKNTVTAEAAVPALKEMDVQMKGRLASDEGLFSKRSVQHHRTHQFSHYLILSIPLEDKVGSTTKIKKASKNGKGRRIHHSTLFDNTY